MLIASPDPITLLDAQRRLWVAGHALAPPQLRRVLDLAAVYHDLTNTIGLHFGFTFAQALLESDWLRSPVYASTFNPAGIKNGPSDPRPGDYRRYLSPEAGARDHVNLLAVYTGHRVPQPADPTRLDRIPEIIRGHLGRPAVTFAWELNGIWAVPGTTYGEDISRLWRTVFGPTP